MRELFFFFAIVAGVSAQDVAPPPKPVDNGPSLADTMKFIQDKLNGVGRVNVIAYLHDGKTGSDWAVSHGYEITNVRASAAKCGIDWHFLRTTDGKETDNLNFSFLAGDVQEVQVFPIEQGWKLGDAADGHPELTAKADPPVFVLNVLLSGDPAVSAWFFDESMANRVAKALVHAVELCGGGNKDPF